MNPTQILDKLQASATGIVTVSSYKGRAPGVGRIQGGTRIVASVMQMATRGIISIVNDTNYVSKSNGYKLNTREVSYTIA